MQKQPTKVERDSNLVQLYIWNF